MKEAAKKANVLSPKTLKELRAGAKIKGVDPQIVVKKTAEGETTIGFGDVGIFWGFANGSLGSWEIPASPRLPEEEAP